MVAFLNFPIPVFIWQGSAQTKTDARQRLFVHQFFFEILRGKLVRDRPELIPLRMYDV